MTLTPEQLLELKRVAGVTSLKDAGGDAVWSTALLQAGQQGPTLLNGWDTLTFSALAAGVRAVVWGVASIVPEPCVELHRLLIDDIDLPVARELWARLWPLCSFLEGRSYPAAVKAACALVGDTTGPVRAPLLALSDEETTELAAALETWLLARAHHPRRGARRTPRDQEKLFGPVLTLLRAPDLADAIELVNASRYDNASVIFTESGGAARAYRFFDVA